LIPVKEETISAMESRNDRADTESQASIDAQQQPIEDRHRPYDFPLAGAPPIGADRVVATVMLLSQMPHERLVENCGKHGVQLGGGFILKRLH
jgi:hypothetical protein